MFRSKSSFVRDHGNGRKELNDNRDKAQLFLSACLPPVCPRHGFVFRCPFIQLASQRGRGRQLTTEIEIMCDYSEGEFKNKISGINSTQWCIICINSLTLQNKKKRLHSEFEGKNVRENPIFSMGLL